jgi:hypothetical protein
VPEAATQMLLRTKDLFKRATGSEAAIEGAVKNVQNALSTTLKREGEALGAVEKKLGIHKDAQTKILEMAAGRDTGGYIAKLGQMQPEQLLGEYVGLKATNKMLTPTQRLSQLVELKRALNDRIKTHGEIGSSTQGLLKTAAKDIDSIVKATPGGTEIRNVQAKYHRARTLHTTLKALLKDEGKAEAILENVFKSQSANYKSIRRGLAELEKLSGEPVLTNLFQQFAVKHLNKVVGKGGRASFGAGMTMTGLATMPFNPIAGVAQVATGSGLMASQSPRAMSRIVMNAPKTAQLPGAVVGGTAASSASQADTKVDVNRIRQYLLKASRQPGGM